MDIWLGNNNIMHVESIPTISDFRTTTTVNTGPGDDLLTVSLDSVENADAMFVANGQDGADTIDCSNSSLPVFLFGGNGRDTMIGGSANDVVFGDFGRVLCR